MRMPGSVIAATVVAGLAAGCGSHPSQPALRSDDCNAPFYYVALGDSTVEGVGASNPALNYVSRLHTRLLARYPNSRLKNLGIGGATSGDVVRRQLDRAIRFQPLLVTLSVGPNDITAGIPVDVYGHHLDIIFGRLRTATTAIVAVNLIPDLAVTARFASDPQVDLVGRRTARFNEALARKAREYGVVLVDLYLPSREEVPRRAELLWKDGYHPSDAGYARWAELMWEGIGPQLEDCRGKRMPARISGPPQALRNSVQERATIFDQREHIPLNVARNLSQLRKAGPPPDAAPLPVRQDVDPRELHRLRRSAHELRESDDLAARFGDEEARSLCRECVTQAFP